MGVVALVVLGVGFVVAEVLFVHMHVRAQSSDRAFFRNDREKRWQGRACKTEYAVPLN